VFADNEIRYVLAQFVDIHGAAKAKAVPVEHYDMVLGDGAASPVSHSGLAWGRTARITWASAIRDAVCLALDPGFARVACDGHVRGCALSLCSRVALKNQLKRLESKGLTMYAGIEPEFMLLKRKESGGYAPFDDTDTLDKPCYDYKGLSRATAILDEISTSMRAVDVDVYQIDHEDGNGQFE